MTDRFICAKCESEFDSSEFVDEDQGGYEEVWGARVWCPMMTAITPCCHSEDYEEITDGD